MKEIKKYIIRTFKIVTSVLIVLALCCLIYIYFGIYKGVIPSFSTYKEEWHEEDSTLFSPAVKNGRYGDIFVMNERGELFANTFDYNCDGNQVMLDVNGQFVRFTCTSYRISNITIFIPVSNAGVAFIKNLLSSNIDLIIDDAGDWDIHLRGFTISSKGYWENATPEGIRLREKKKQDALNKRKLRLEKAEKDFKNKLDNAL